MSLFYPDDPLAPYRRQPGETPQPWDEKSPALPLPPYQEPPSPMHSGLLGRRLFRGGPDIGSLLFGVLAATHPRDAIAAYGGYQQGRQAQRQRYFDQQAKLIPLQLEAQRNAEIARHNLADETQRANDPKDEYSLLGKLAAMNPAVLADAWTKLGLHGDAPVLPPGTLGSSDRIRLGHEDRVYGIDQNNQTRGNIALLNNGMKLLQFAGPTEGAITDFDLYGHRLAQGSKMGDYGSGADARLLLNNPYARGGTAAKAVQDTIQLENKNAVTGAPAYIASSIKAPGIQNNLRVAQTGNTQANAAYTRGPKSDLSRALAGVARARPADMAGRLAVARGMLGIAGRNAAINQQRADTGEVTGYAGAGFVPPGMALQPFPDPRNGVAGLPIAPVPANGLRILPGGKLDPAAKAKQPAGETSLLLKGTGAFGQGLALNGYGLDIPPSKAAAHLNKWRSNFPEIFVQTPFGVSLKPGLDSPDAEGHDAYVLFKADQDKLNKSARVVAPAGSGKAEVSALMNSLLGNRAKPRPVGPKVKRSTTGDGWVVVR